MKATGIVRRIDDLGRIVIPKEIRRTMRIREGDPLEIFTSKDGEVIFKKYSPIGELGEFATEYVESLSKTSGYAVAITDKDTVIAISGAPKREFTDKRVSGELERIMQDKATFIMNVNTQNTPILDGCEKFVAGVIAPIISEGDSIGSVVMINMADNIRDMGETETKLAQSAAGFLGRHMQQ